MKASASGTAADLAPGAEDGMQILNSKYVLSFFLAFNKLCLCILCFRYSGRESCSVSISTHLLCRIWPISLHIYFLIDGNKLKGQWLRICLQ